MQRPGARIALLISFQIFLVLLALPAIAAGAEHPFLEAFGSVSQPAFTQVEGLAVDQSSEDVYAIDFGTSTVSRYKKDGTADAFSCTPGPSCPVSENKITGRSFGFGGPAEVEVAVDSSGTATNGDIYVTEPGIGAISVFAQDGTLLGELTESTEGPLGEPCGVSVDASGNVYVAQFEPGRVHKYVPNGVESAPVNGDNTLNFEADEPCVVAAGAGPSSGAVFVATLGGKVTKFNAGTGAGEGEVTPSSTSISIDPGSGHLYVARLGLAGEVAEFDVSGPSPVEKSNTALGSAGYGVAVNESTGDVYVAREGHSQLEVFAPLPPSEFPLTIERTGTGEGTVTSTPPGINCGLECSAEFKESEEVELEAVAASGSEFTGWGTVTDPPGTCTGTTTPCEVTVSEAVELEAEFVLQPTLTVTKTGTGAGSVECEFNGGGLEPCTGTHPHPIATSVEVVSTPSVGSELGTISGTGSAGSCATSPCSFTLEADSSVSVEFKAEAGKVKLECETIGTGSGTINVSSGSCGSLFTEGTVLELSAAPGSHSLFAGWSVTGSGGVTTPCTGTTSPCEVKLDAPGPVKAVATFSLEKHLLTVTREGTGTGSVESTSPVSPKINCGSECSKEFDHGTLVKLKGISGANTLPVSWTGCDVVNGSNECEVTMTAVKAVTSTFSLEKHSLTVTKEGTGTGTVESTSPVSPKINCGSECSKEFDHGTLVKLKGVPGANSQAVSWVEGCDAVNGSNECEVTVSGAKSVKAKFDLVKHLLTVTSNGTGSGTIESTPPGISCPSNCAAEFEHGTLVKLKGTPGAHSKPVEWSGCDAVNGSNECEVTMSGVKSATGTFTRITHTLSATVVGGGVGSVACKLEGDAAFGSCARAINEGSKVEVKATPAAGSNFVGWTEGTGSAEGCSNAPATNPCVIPLFETNSTLKATISKNVRNLGVTIVGTGTVECKVGAGSFGACAASYNENEVVKLKETPGTHFAFAGWSEVTGSGSVTTPCAGTAAECEVKLTGNVSLKATFAKITHTLSISTAGTGSGAVTCNGGACAASYDEGTSVTLAAAANAGSSFAGFSGGGCSGTTCTMTMGADTTVTATFNSNPPEVQCKVPKLKGLALGAAKSAITKAHCKVGTVHKPKARKGKKLGPLVVKSSSPAAGAVRPEGTKVSLTLGPKPKKKR